MKRFFRMFSTDKYKGSRNYLNSQKKYEIIRTLLYFGMSLGLFLIGYFTTKSYNAAHGHPDADPRLNLLTIIAILGCLPACKSAVSTIMFLRFRSLSRAAAEEIELHSKGLAQLYDMVFTSYSKNYCVAHLVVKGNTVCGYTEDTDFEENAFYKHIGDILKADNFRDITVKIFTDLHKYTARLDQLLLLEADESRTEGIINTLKSVAL